MYQSGILHYDDRTLRSLFQCNRDATAEEIGNYYQQYLIPRMISDEASQAFIAVMMRVAPHEKPYAHPFYWGAFTYNGV